MLHHRFTLKEFFVGLAAAGCFWATAGEAKNLKVVYIPGLTGDPFYISVDCGARDAAKARGGIDYSYQGAPNYSPAEQIPMLQTVAGTKPDVIMISQTDPQALIPPLKQAQDDGIKVIFIDGRVADPSIGLANLQSNNITAGSELAQRLVQAMGGKGKVLVITNFPGVVVTDQRIKGFLDAIKQMPGVEALDVQYVENDTARAAAAVNASLAAHPDLKGVIGITTGNTIGAATAVRQLRQEGTAVALVGFDSSDAIVEAVRDGTIAAQVIQGPYQMGQIGIDLAGQVVSGKTVEQEIKTPYVIATKDNISSPDVQKFVYRTSCGS